MTGWTISIHKREALVVRYAELSARGKRLRDVGLPSFSLCSPTANKPATTSQWHTCRSLLLNDFCVCQRRAVGKDFERRERKRGSNRPKPCRGAQTCGTRTSPAKPHAWGPPETKTANRDRLAVECWWWSSLRGKTQLFNERGLPRRAVEGCGSLTTCAHQEGA